MLKEQGSLRRTLDQYKTLVYLLEHVIVFIQSGVEDPVHLVWPPVDGDLAPTT